MHILGRHDLKLGGYQRPEEAAKGLLQPEHARKRASEAENHFRNHPELANSHQFYPFGRSPTLSMRLSCSSSLCTWPLERQNRSRRGKASFRAWSKAPRNLCLGIPAAHLLDFRT